MSSTNEIQIGGNTYSIGKMDAITQLHVARRIAPVMSAAGISAAQLQASGALANADAQGAGTSEAPQGDPTGTLMMWMGPAIKVVAEMRDEDVNYVTNACLDVVRRKQVTAPDGTGQWAKVRVNGGLMFQDLDGNQILLLVMAVLRESLSGFFGQLFAGESTS